MTRLDRCLEVLFEGDSARRYFTPAEANRALVLVKRIVADVVMEYARLLELLEAMEAAEGSGATDYLQEAHDELRRTSGKLRDCLEELDDAGVRLGDWSLGEVTFLSVAGGREVLLCWHYGEPAVGHWREVDDPSEGRQPIASLLAELAAAEAPSA